MLAIKLAHVGSSKKITVLFQSVSIDPNGAYTEGGGLVSSYIYFFFSKCLEAKLLATWIVSKSAGKNLDGSKRSKAQVECSMNVLSMNKMQMYFIF